MRCEMTIYRSSMWVACGVFATIHILKGDISAGASFIAAMFVILAMHEPD